MLFYISIFFLPINTNAQAYQFTSDKEVMVKLNPTNIQIEKKLISIIIDINNKKITIDRGEEKVFIIISTKTTMLDKERGKIFNCQCIDNDGEKHSIAFMIYSDILQNKLDVSGSLAVTYNSFTYSYELHKK